MRKVPMRWDVACWTKSASGVLATLIFRIRCILDVATLSKKEMLKWKKHVLQLGQLL